MNDNNRIKTIEDLLRKYNLDGYKRDKQRIYQIQGELTNTNGILEDFVDTTTQNMELINNQLDGNVTSWFYNYVPTLLNVPASNWTTDDLKKEHLEDLFYNTDTGKVYKFVYDEDTTTYSWLEVTNILGAQAFAVANASQDITDGNRRVFVVQPTPPYDIGDVWCDNVNHILYRCFTAKATGETFSVDDWLDSLKYLDTDDGDKLVDAINNRTTVKTISANKLFIEGDEINMTSKDLSITSTNFDLDKNGKMKIKNTSTFGGNFMIDNGVSGSGNKYVTITSDCISFIKETSGIEQYCYFGNDGNNNFGMMMDGYITLKQGVIYNTIDRYGFTIYDNTYNNKKKAEYTKNGLNVMNNNDEETAYFNGSQSQGSFYIGRGVNNTNNYIYGYAGDTNDNYITIQKSSSSYCNYNNTGQHPSSDRRCKDNIEEIDEQKSMNIITNLKPVTYTYKEETDYHRGLIAQEVKETLDNEGIKDQVYDYDEERDRYTLNYSELIPDLINCIKYQQKEIEELKEEINKLKGGSQ